MQVTRISEAPFYVAPEHYDMRSLRLQGREAGPTDTVWLGLSHILPGGHTSLSAADVEKIYVCISGAVTVRTDSEVVILHPLDSCRLAPGEPRALENHTNLPVTVLLVMPEAR